MTLRRLLLTLTALAALTGARAQGSLTQQIAEKQRAIDALEKQLAAGEREIEQLRKGQDAEQRTVQQLTRQIASRRQLLDETESQVSLLERQIARTDSIASRLDANLARYRDEYGAMVREAYRNYRHNNYLTYLFAAEDFADVARRIANIRGVAAMRQHLMHEIEATAERVTDQKTQLARQQASLDSVRRNLSTQKSRYERDQANARARMKQLSSREQSVLRQQESYEQRLSEAVRELQKLTKGNTAGASFSASTSNLNLPVVGGRVKRYKENMAEIVGPKGAQIIAIYEGKVVDVKRNKITNRYDVYVAHGEYITSYANLNSVCVAKGSTVAKNAPLGVIGTAVDIATMTPEYRLVFGIYPPAGAKAMRASDCFRK